MLKELNIFIKNKGKKIIAFSLFYSGYYDFQLRRSRNKSVILMYHRVSESSAGDNCTKFEVGVAKNNFEAQMKYIRKNMNPLPLSDLVGYIIAGKEIPEKTIAVTFDDGYEDNYINAYPVLKKYSIPATIFLTTDHIESSKIFWWDKVSEIIKKTSESFINVNEFRTVSNSRFNLQDSLKLGNWTQKAYAIGTIINLFKTFEYKKIPDAVDLLQRMLDIDNKDIENPAMVTWKQIKEMSNNGIDFGAHTATHPDLTKIDLKEAEKEILKSKETIENKTNNTASGFAYPFGLSVNLNNQIKKIARDYFQYACTAKMGPVADCSDIYGLKRVSVPNSSVSLVLDKITKALKYFSA